MIRNAIDLNRIVKITEVSGDTEEIANLIMNNKFFFFKNLDVINFENGIDWNYKHQRNENSYLLYLHSLQSISYLTNGYEKTGEVKYLKKAFSILENWIEFDQTDHKNFFAWYDHSTAYRTHNLVYFYIMAKDTLELNIGNFKELIQKHADYLYNNENYRKNNHGVMMDRALILLGLFFEHENAEIWIQKGIWRLQDTFNSSYSFKGVHLENSTEYHRFVQRLYISIEEFLNKNELTLGEEITRKFDLIDKYYQYIAKPDKNLPMLGDSATITMSSITKEFTPFIDQTAGIAVLQAENIENDYNSTWISFICGYGTTTHKHYDDLSFSLYYNGNDVFIDSGKYGYGRSKMRSYVRSALAHNTITIEGEKYPLLDPFEAMDTITITDFSHNYFYNLVKGKNDAYNGVKISRTLLFIKPDIVFIFDSVDSEKEHKYLQNFNLAPHISIVNVRNDLVNIETENDKIEIEQLLGSDDVNIYQGDTDTPRAVISEKTGKVTKTTQIEFVKKGKKGNFLTVIKMGEGINRLKETYFNSSTNLLYIKVDNETFNIPL
jgi:hypothetical protein